MNTYFFTYFFNTFLLSLKRAMDDEHPMDVDRPMKMEKDYTAIVDAQLPQIVEVAKVFSPSFHILLLVFL